MKGQSSGGRVRIWMVGADPLASALAEALMDSGCELRVCDGKTDGAVDGCPDLWVACGDDGVHDAMASRQRAAARLGVGLVPILAVRRGRQDRGQERVASISPALGLRRVALTIAALADELRGTTVEDGGAAFRRRVSAVLHRVERMSALSGSLRPPVGPSMSPPLGELTSGRSRSLRPAPVPPSTLYPPGDSAEPGEISGIFGQGAGPYSAPDAKREPRAERARQHTRRTSPPPPPDRQDWSLGGLAERLEPERMTFEQDVSLAGHPSSSGLPEHNDCASDERSERPTVPAPPSQDAGWEAEAAFALLASELGREPRAVRGDGFGWPQNESGPRPRDPRSLAPPSLGKTGRM